MVSSSTYDAIVAWLNTVLPDRISSLDDLIENDRLKKLAQSIAHDFTWPSDIHVEDQEQRLRNVINGLEAFLKRSSEDHIHFTVNVADVLSKNQQALIALGELVLLAAVNSDARDTYIEDITGLDDDVQEELMTIVQSYMHDAEEDTDHFPSHERNVSHMSDAYTDISAGDLSRRPDHAYSDSIQELKSRLEELQLHNDALTGENKTLKAKIDSKKLDEVTESEQSSNALNRHIEDLLKQLREQQSQLSSAEAAHIEERNSLKDQLKGVQDELDVARARASALDRAESEKSRYKTLYEQTRAEVQTLQTSNVSKDAKQSSSEAEETIQKLRTDLDATTTKLLRAEQSLSKVQGEKDALKDQLATLKENNQDITRERDTLKRHLSEMKNLANNQSRANLGESSLQNDEIQRLRASNDNLQSALDRTAAELKAAEHERDTALKAASSDAAEKVYESQIIRLNEALEQERCKCEVLQERLEEERLRSGSAQSLVAATMYRIGEHLLKQTIISTQSPPSKANTVVRAPLESARARMRQRILSTGHPDTPS